MHNGCSEADEDPLSLLVRVLGDVVREGWCFVLRRGKLFDADGDAGVDIMRGRRGR